MGFNPHAYPINTASLNQRGDISQHLNEAWTFSQHRVQPEKHFRVRGILQDQNRIGLPIDAVAQRRVGSRTNS